MMASKLCSKLFSNERKKGVALLFVLGLLAMVVTLAVSFAGMMRSERVLASNSAEIVKTRQLTLSALDMLVYEFNNDNAWLGTNAFTSKVWTNEMHSLDEAGLVHNPLDGSFMRNGPGQGSLLHIPVAVRNAEGNLTSEFWEKDSTPQNQAYGIFGPQSVGSGNKPLIGRFSFVAIDQSGGLDMNVVSPTNNVTYDPGRRNTSHNLYLEELSVFNTGEGKRGDLSNFLDYIDDFAPVFSLSDYRERSQHVGTNFAQTARVDVNGERQWPVDTKNWCTYTKYPQVWSLPDNPNFASNHTITNRINLLEANDLPAAVRMVGVTRQVGDDVRKSYDSLYEDKWFQQGFTNAFSGKHILAALDDRWVTNPIDSSKDEKLLNKAFFASIVDYIDEDFLPYSGVPFNDDYHSRYGLGTEVTEPIPLFTQIVWDTNAQRLPGTNEIYKLSMSVTFELWFPFAGVTNKENYAIKFKDTTRGGSVSIPFANGTSRSYNIQGWKKSNSADPLDKIPVGHFNKDALPSLVNNSRSRGTKDSVGGDSSWSQMTWSSKDRGLLPSQRRVQNWDILGSDPTNQFATITYTCGDTGTNTVTREQLDYINKNFETRFHLELVDRGPELDNLPDIAVNGIDWGWWSAAKMNLKSGPNAFFDPGNPHQFSMRAWKPNKTKQSSTWACAHPQDLGRIKRGTNGGDNHYDSGLSGGNDHGWAAAWTESVMPYFPRVLKSGGIHNVAELLFCGNGQGNNMQPFWCKFDKSGDSGSSQFANERNTSAYWINLDAFKIGTNDFRRGLVNVNTLEPESMAAALFSERSSKYFSKANTNGKKVEEVDWGNLGDDADSHSALGIARDVIAEGPFKNKSEFAAALIKICDRNSVARIEFSPGKGNKSYREAILANSFDMFDVGGNTILVGLRVENINDLNKDGNFDENIDLIISTRDLVATLWRDPYTKETQIVSVMWPELME